MPFIRSLAHFKNMILPFKQFKFNYKQYNRDNHYLNGQILFWSHAVELFTRKMVNFSHGKHAKSFCAPPHLYMGISCKLNGIDSYANWSDIETHSLYVSQFRFFSVLSEESANEIPLNLAKTNLQEACCNTQTQYILMMLMMMMMFILGTKAFGTNVICHRKGLVSPEKSHRRSLIDGETKAEKKNNASSCNDVIAKMCTC